jgi:hypothetical protein
MKSFSVGPLCNEVVSYEDNSISFSDRSLIVVADIGIFDFYLTGYYRARHWLELASA